ncbi:hypothetical protein TSUD_54350 [Trifolium subterraneum]|uniref:Uncharacterized protein n=1 Tax=Trifolium subterraneum TaxID=3900 RepID=A0A2Z6P835_TRISU|nr:hypothetical protein TSUD_54350 [Trifolium subterraneum]
MIITSQQSPLSTPPTSPSSSPNHVIDTTSSPTPTHNMEQEAATPSTPNHNMAPVVTPSTPLVIHLSIPSLIESLQHDLYHLTYLRDEAVIHPDDLVTRLATEEVTRLATEASQQLLQLSAEPSNAETSNVEPIATELANVAPVATEPSNVEPAATEPSNDK